jgi:hypothetical protein
MQVESSPQLRHDFVFTQLAQNLAFSLCFSLSTPLTTSCPRGANFY